MRLAIFGLATGGVAAALYLLAAVLHPPLLMFPHARTVGATPVYSEAPIPGQVVAVIARADALTGASPLFTPAVLSRPVYLTDGGWRWRLLTFGSRAFGQSRPLVETIVINRVDVAGDRVWNGRAGDAARSLSGVIAHERTHGLIRTRFGFLADRLYPTWVREGYCDHVAGESTLSDAAAAALVAEGRRTPALAYYEARRRVEAALADNGGSVEALFADALRR